MSLSTYAGLKESVASFLNKTNLAASIPDFIALAEAQMRRDIRARPEVVTIDTNIGDTVYPLPCGFDGVVSITRTAEDRTALVFTPADQLDSSHPQIYGTRYCISGGLFYFDAAPGDVRVRYRSLFSPLSASTACNWLLDKHPDAYLYGTLQQSAPFLRDDERMGVWASLYARAVEAINQQSIRQETGGPLTIQVSACP